MMTNGVNVMNIQSGRQLHSVLNSLHDRLLIDQILKNRDVEIIDGLVGPRILLM